VHLHEHFHRITDRISSDQECTLEVNLPSPLLTVCGFSVRAGQSLVPPLQATGLLYGDRDKPRWTWRTWVNAHRKSSIAWWHATLLNVFCVSSRTEKDLCGLKQQPGDLPWELPAEHHLISVLPLTGPVGLTRKEHSPGMTFSKEKVHSLLWVKILHCSSWKAIQSKKSWWCLQG